MNQFTRLPDIYFSNELVINEISKTRDQLCEVLDVVNNTDKPIMNNETDSNRRLKEIIRNILVFNEIGKEHIDKIMIKCINGVFFGLFDYKKTNDRITLTLAVPENLAFDENTKLWTCDFNGYLFGIKYATRTLEFTDDQLRYIICHEFNHFLHGDFEQISVMMSVIYSITTNPVILTVSTCYSKWLTLLLLAFNHSYSRYSIFRELQIDIMAIEKIPELKEPAIEFYKHYGNVATSYVSCFGKYFDVLRSYYSTITGSFTHPDNENRVEVIKRNYY